MAECDCYVEILAAKEDANYRIIHCSLHASAERMKEENAELQRELQEARAEKEAANRLAEHAMGDRLKFKEQFELLDDPQGLYTETRNAVRAEVWAKCLQIAKDWEGMSANDFDAKYQFKSKPGLVGVSDALEAASKEGE